MHGWKEALEEAGLQIFESNGILTMAPVEHCYYVYRSVESTEERTLACVLACRTVAQADTFRVNWLAVLEAARELHKRRSTDTVNVLLLLEQVKDLVEVTKHSTVDDGKEVADHVYDLQEGEGLLVYSYPKCWAAFRNPKTGELWLYDPSAEEGVPMLQGCSRLWHLQGALPHMFYPSKPVHVLYLGNK